MESCEGLWGCEKGVGEFYSTPLQPTATWSNQGMILPDMASRAVRPAEKPATLVHIEAPHEMIMLPR
jgi:hypothetical protein